MLYNTYRWKRENNEYQEPEEKLWIISLGRGKDDLPESQISRNQTCQNIAKNVSNQDFSMNQT